jgi:(R,R)-butanediol dehydrogenase/meso-butanediol dehydrogenase/diacetyl reductase
MGAVGLSWAWGGLGEQAVVRDYQVAVLPDELSYEQGALIEPTAVAQYGVDAAPVRPGDTVLITGAGPIGALTVLCATAAGAGAVYVSEPNARRAERARRLGAAEVFDPTAVDLVGELRERTGGVGVDVALECVGNGPALDACVRAVRRAGTVVQVGLHTTPAELDPMLWALNDLTIRGTWCYPVYDWPRIAGLIASGRLPVERAVTGRIGIEDVVGRGFDALLDPGGDQVKLLVAVGDRAAAGPAPLGAAGAG